MHRGGRTIAGQSGSTRGTLRMLQMRAGTAQTHRCANSHVPPDHPTLTTHMQAYAPRHPPAPNRTAARNALAAAPMATEESPKVNLQGLDATDLDPIDLHDVVRLDRQLGHRSPFSVPFAPAATAASRLSIHAWIVIFSMCKSGVNMNA